MAVNQNFPDISQARYEVVLHYHKQKTSVFYQMVVEDSALGRSRRLMFRFSQAENFHEELIKRLKKNNGKEGFVPEFPKKNSLAFWNRTNNDHRKIESRQRELEYYFSKVLNQPMLAGLLPVKRLLTAGVKIQSRPKSVLGESKRQLIRNRAKSLSSTTSQVVEKPSGKKIL